jgi:hypothetical protein
MKVRALRNFFWYDKIREKMIQFEKLKEYDVDIEKQSEEVYAAVQSRSVEIIDESYIPPKAKYLGLNPYSERAADGALLKIVPGQTVTLEAGIACRLMAAGIVKPEDPKAWTPGRLLMPAVSKKVPKKMYDLDEAPANWTQEYHVKGGNQ